jgi:hypothetical protein
MKRLFALALLGLFASASAPAFSQTPSCEAQATEKKLAGAAKTSFVKKCEKDMAAAATKACTDQAAEKKLAGAAKSSFIKKCAETPKSSAETPKSSAETPKSKMAMCNERTKGMSKADADKARSECMKA